MISHWLAILSSTNEKSDSLKRKPLDYGAPARAYQSVVLDLNSIFLETIDGVLENHVTRL